MTDLFIYLPFALSLFAGTIFGLIAANTRFCLLGAISDIWLMQNKSRAVFWGITAMSALAGTSLLRWLDLLDVSQTTFLITPVTLLPAIIGGSLFGIGMVLATGCLVKNILRIGSGCLKSVVVVILTALSARFVFSGPLSAFRSWLYDTWPIFINSQVLEVPYLAIVAIILLLAQIFFVWKKTIYPFSFWIKAVLLGSIVSMVWLMTSWLIMQAGQSDCSLMLLPDGRLIPLSLAFLRSVVNVLDWLLWSKDVFTFSLGILMGTLAGSALYYAIKGRWVFSGFQNVYDLRNHLIGALLMGIGAALAGGCSIGQGLSGLSTGSVHALVTLCCMVLSASVILIYMDKKA